MASSTATYETGVISQETSLIWKISNFPVVLKQAAMVNSQRFEFYAGERIGMASKWVAYLLVKEETGGASSAGLYLELKERPQTAVLLEHLFVKFTLTFKDKDGVVKKQLDTKLVDWYDKKVIAKPTTGYGFANVFDMKVGEGVALPWYSTLLEEGSLAIDLTLKMFAMSKAASPITEMLKGFEINSTAKAREDLTMLIADPVASNDITIVGYDKVEFKMQRDILSARSPVFQAMLATDMLEGNSQRIEIPDMGSNSLMTMLHFIYRGELLPRWTLSEVLPELTNAAGKYQLMDLLQFLDGVLGSVCKLTNVGALIPLAHRLSLKKAEKDLLSFIRRKGANSAEGFMEVCEGILAMDSNPGEGSSRTPHVVVKVEKIESEEPSTSKPRRRTREGLRSGPRKRYPCESDEDEEVKPTSKRSKKTKGVKK